MSYFQDKKILFTRRFKIVILSIAVKNSYKKRRTINIVVSIKYDVWTRHIYCQVTSYPRGKFTKLRWANVLLIIVWRGEMNISIGTEHDTQCALCMFLCSIKHDAHLCVMYALMFYQTQRTMSAIYALMFYQTRPTKCVMFGLFFFCILHFDFCFCFF